MRRHRGDRPRGGEGAMDITAIAIAVLVGLALLAAAARACSAPLKLLLKVGLNTLVGLAALAGIETAVVFRGEADNSAVPVDAVIVLGAGVNGETPSAALWSRIRAAEDYLETHPDVPVVLSGGQGAGEAISEAEAMRRALWTEDGAENARLLLEERSTNTAENFRFSKALLEERGLDTETAVVAVVTNDFHCFRAHMIAQKQGLRTIDVPAELPWWWLTANYYLREAFAVVKTALFD